MALDTVEGRGLTIVKQEEKLTPERLKAVEKIIGVNLPEEYRNFLLAHNGGSPRPQAFEYRCGGGPPKLGAVAYFLAIYDGDAENFLDFYETFRGRIPHDTISVARDPGGNLILLGTRGPNAAKVFFWIKDQEADEDEEPDHSNLCFIAESFKKFLDSLKNVD